MKNKSIYVGAIIRSSIIFVFLLTIISKNQNMISRLMIIPFILCSLFSIGKNICLMIDKKKFATIFSKLFVISFLTFWFGLLIYGSYLFIKEKNFSQLLFTIPFWIAGVYIIRRFLFGIESKKKFKENTKREPKFNFKIVVSCFLVLSVLIIGIVCLYFGIRDTYKLNKISKEYVTTDAYFKDYKIYNTSKKDGTTYELIYTYKVDGEQYTVTTDYGVRYIPEINSIREVKYNPNNHSEAILVGTNTSNFLIYFGAFFTLGGMVFVLAALYIKGVFNNVKIDVIGTYCGIVFIVIGIGFLLFYNGITSSFADTIKALGLWILIPILFIVVGTFQTIKCLFFKSKDISTNK